MLGIGDYPAEFFIRLAMPCTEPVIMCYLESGSANDYAYSIGIPSNMETALHNTLNGTVRRIDIGNFNRKYC